MSRSSGLKRVRTRKKLRKTWEMCWESSWAATKVAVPEADIVTTVDCTTTSAEKRCWGLLRPRLCLIPTLRGWIVFGLSFALVLALAIRALHPFLAVNDPVADGLLVVEGWMPDYGMEIAIEEFKRNHYQTVYVTGGPLEYGMHLAAYRTYAQLGAAT